MLQDSSLASSSLKSLIKEQAGIREQAGIFKEINKQAEWNICWSLINEQGGNDHM